MTATTRSLEIDQLDLVHDLVPGLARLDPAQVEAVDAWWRAALYLTVGQIYLRDNPLLREPLRPEHIKPRLLGHWGTSPGSPSCTRTCHA